MISVTSILIIDFCALIVNWCALNLNTRLVNILALKIVPHAKKILGIIIKHIRYFSNFVFKKKPIIGPIRPHFQAKFKIFFGRELKMETHQD
jgi:hypothetical protein